jgi:hypothetical protein
MKFPNLCEVGVCFDRVLRLVFDESIDHFFSASFSAHLPFNVLRDLTLLRKSFYIFIPVRL